MKNLIITTLVLVFSLYTSTSFATDADAAQAERINQQLKSPGRDQYDAPKDPGRKPVEVVQFFGIKEGMTVLDIYTGAGYNAEILSAAVGPNGLVYAQNYHYVLQLINGERHQAMLSRLKNNRLPNVRYIVVNPEDMPFENSVDLVYWGFNMHDIHNSDKAYIGEAGVQLFLRGMYRALKPGGILAVSDHVGKAGYDNAKLHRLEPRIIKDVLIKAGFVIEATSDLLSNPDDDHSQSIYADGLRYNTDRILVRARKP